MSGEDRDRDRDSDSGSGGGGGGTNALDDFLAEASGGGGGGGSGSGGGGDEFEVYHVTDDTGTNHHSTAPPPNTEPPAPVTVIPIPVPVPVPIAAADTTTTTTTTAAAAAAVPQPITNTTANGSDARPTKPPTDPTPLDSKTESKTESPLSAAVDARTDRTDRTERTETVNEQFDSILQRLDTLQLNVKSHVHERSAADVLSDFQLKQSADSIRHQITSFNNEQTAMQNARHEKQLRVDSLKARVAEENDKSTALKARLDALRERKQQLMERAEHRKGGKKNPHFPFIIRASKANSLDSTLIKTAKSLAKAEQKSASAAFAAAVSTGSGGGSGSGSGGVKTMQHHRRTGTGTGTGGVGRRTSNGVSGGGWSDVVRRRVTPYVLPNLHAYIQLPSTVIVSLFSFVGVRDLDSSRAVCHAWCTAIGRTKTWKHAMNRVAGVDTKMKVWLSEQLAAQKAAQKAAAADHKSRGGRTLSSADIAAPTPAASAAMVAAAAAAASTGKAVSVTTSAAATTAAIAATTHLHHTLTIEVTSNDGYIVSVNAERVSNRDCDPYGNAGSITPGVSLSPAALAAARNGGITPTPTPTSGAAGIQTAKPLSATAIASPERDRPSASHQGGSGSGGGGADGSTVPMVVPGTPGIDKKRKTVTVVICDIRHRPAGSGAGTSSVLDKERIFCGAVMDQHIRLTQYQLEKARLLAQMDEDERYKKSSKLELSHCHSVLQSVKSRTDDLKQQFQSDEITKQFLLEQFNDVSARANQSRNVTAASKAKIAKLLDDKKEELKSLEDGERKRHSAASATADGGGGAASKQSVDPNEPVLQLRGHKQVLAKELKQLQIALDKMRLELTEKEHEAIKTQAMYRATGGGGGAGSAAATR